MAQAQHLTIVPANVGGKCAEHVPGFHGGLQVAEGGGRVKKARRKPDEIVSLLPQVLQID